MLEHGSFLFGVPELFRGGFLPSGGVIGYCSVISLFLDLFKRFITKHSFVYGNTINS